jgi:hypothetical protein
MTAIATLSNKVLFGLRLISRAPLVPFLLWEELEDKASNGDQKEDAHAPFSPSCHHWQIPSVLFDPAWIDRWKNPNGRHRRKEMLSPISTGDISTLSEFDIFKTSRQSLSEGVNMSNADLLDLGKDLLETQSRIFLPLSPHRKPHRRWWNFWCSSYLVTTAFRMETEGLNIFTFQGADNFLLMKFWHFPSHIFFRHHHEGRIFILWSWSDNCVVEIDQTMRWFRGDRSMTLIT